MTSLIDIISIHELAEKILDYCSVTDLIALCQIPSFKTMILYIMKSSHMCKFQLRPSFMKPKCLVTDKSNKFTELVCLKCLSVQSISLEKNHEIKLFKTCFPQIKTPCHADPRCKKHATFTCCLDICKTKFYMYYEVYKFPHICEPISSYYCAYCQDKTFKHYQTAHKCEDKSNYCLHCHEYISRNDSKLVNSRTRSVEDFSKTSRRKFLFDFQMSE